jgi:hypothetical protein
MAVFMSHLCHFLTIGKDAPQLCIVTAKWSPTAYSLKDFPLSHPNGDDLSSYLALLSFIFQPITLS